LVAEGARQNAPRSFRAAFGLLGANRLRLSQFWERTQMR
jgi:hypothetical protein